MPFTLLDKSQQFFESMTKASHAAAKIDENCVYQEANEGTRKYMNILLKENMVPGSGLGNIAQFKAFYDAVVKEGKKGVIMMEHFSNLDLPAIIYLLENCGEEWGKDFASRIVAIAGMKLNEASAGVRAFTEAFTRVVIYPTRSLDSFKGTEEEKAEEEKRARKINFAAMRAMDDCKKRGQIILVFPSGTRYRPGKPETKRGLKEIDSYLRLFDVMLPVSINGSCLAINPANPNDMLADIIQYNKVTLTASDVVNCKEFRNKLLENMPADVEDPKQYTVDCVMKLMEKKHQEVEFEQELSGTTYPGRGIIAGKSDDGKYAVSAYWTMGRSAGSRNRVFVTENENGNEVIRTKAFDPSLIAGDPSLIIYAAVRQLGNKTIVTNGDQTDTIYEGLQKGLTFEESLRSRKYEHDAPNYTPRISSLLTVENGKYDYAISILKSDNGNPDNTLRFTFTYDNPQNGEGHYIHTYQGDGDPLPSFAGEPVKLPIHGNIDEFADKIWNTINEDNKVSLFVRYIELATGKAETRIFNKNK